MYKLHKYSIKIRSGSIKKVRRCRLHIIFYINIFVSIEHMLSIITVNRFGNERWFL